MNISIDNIRFNMNEKDLTALFASFGKVTSAKVVMDRVTDRSKGCGFVNMPDHAEAINAIEKLNGSDTGRGIMLVQEVVSKT